MLIVPCMSITSILFSATGTPMLSWFDLYLYFTGITSGCYTRTIEQSFSRHSKTTSYTNYTQTVSNDSINRMFIQLMITTFPAFTLFIYLNISMEKLLPNLSNILATFLLESLVESSYVFMQLHTMQHQVQLCKLNEQLHTVRKETLEGSNIGDFGEKPSIRQFLNHQCFPTY